MPPFGESLGGEEKLSDDVDANHPSQTRSSEKRSLGQSNELIISVPNGDYGSSTIAGHKPVAHHKCVFPFASISEICVGAFFALTIPSRTLTPKFKGFPIT